MLIIAHRGASAHAPENTLAAFRRAFADGADGLEFDVRLARDDVPVIIHDADLRRTGLLNADVREMTSLELSRVNVGAWFNRRFPRRARDEYEDERLPTLAQTLGLCRSEPHLKALYIELKCKKEDEARRLAVAVMNALRADDSLAARVCVESFYLPAILHVKQLAPEIRAAALFEPTLKHPRRAAFSIIREAQFYQADELALHRSLITHRMIERAKQNNFPVAVWTVDDKSWARRGVEFDLRAVITNHPARLRRALDEIHAEKQG